jgi:signal transduction histidine kinase
MGFVRNSIKNKLYAGFGICVLLLAALVMFNFSSLNKLEKLYQRTFKFSIDMEHATGAQHIGDDLGMIIAHTIITGDLAKTEQDWAAAKKTNLAKLQKVALAADTPEERAKVREARLAYEEIIRVYEQEMLPVLKKGTVAPGSLAAMDARLDEKTREIDLAMEWVAGSMSNDNLKASRAFHELLTNSIRFGLAISLTGVVAALFIAAMSTRRIVRPLSEITRAALEMGKGNYLVAVRHRSDDETGVLADAFRDMSARVERHTVELGDANQRLQAEIAERTRAEEEVRRLNTGLEQRVAERTADLAATVHALQQAEAELKASNEKLRNLSAYLEEAREKERARIAREIHDELGQLLTALKFDSSWLARKIPDSEHALIEKAGSMTELIDTTIKTVQRIATELRPTILDHLGLAPAIESYAQRFQERTGIACKLDIAPDEFTIDQALSTALFRIFQESLTNVLRHADASTVEVILKKKRSHLHLEIVDNGKGIGRKELNDSKSVGLTGMRERAILCGGKLTVSGVRGKGTKVKVTVPLIYEEDSNDQDRNSG